MRARPRKASGLLDSFDVMFKREEQLVMGYSAQDMIRVKVKTQLGATPLEPVLIDTSVAFHEFYCEWNPQTIALIQGLLEARFPKHERGSCA